MTAKRPTLTHVFPDPLSQQWPSTSNPVFCECQQLYALVSLCCCVSGAHLLVLHEGPSTNMLTAMPRGPKYVDFKISRRTSPDDLASFLIRANKAAGVVTGGRWDTAHGADLVVSESAFSPRASPLAPPGAAAPLEDRKAVVVCLHGIALASAEVQGMLLDALLFGAVAQTRSGRRRGSLTMSRPASPQVEHGASPVSAALGASVRSRSSSATAARRHEHTVFIPWVHIIAFCDFQKYAVVLPESLRSAFDLSLFMSRVAMESAAVLQSGDSTKSNVVNRDNMLEVANSGDGESLADTVTLSVTVMRYLRHLLLVLRGSTFNMDSLATYSVRKLNRFMHLLRVATILFEPDDIDPATARGRWMLRLRAAPHSRFLSNGGGGPSLLDEDELDGLGGLGDSDPQQRQSQQQQQPTLRQKPPPTSYAHLVVSTTTVMCLFAPLVAHLPTVSRYTAPHPDVIQAARPLLIAQAGEPSSLGMSFVPTRVQPALHAPGLWDARMVTQSAMLLRNQTTYAMVARAMGGLALDAGSWQAMAAVDTDNGNLGASRLFGSAVNPSSTMNASVAHNVEDAALGMTRLIRSPAALATTGRLLPRGLGLGTAMAEHQLNGTITGLRERLLSGGETTSGLDETYRAPHVTSPPGATLNSDDAADVPRGATLDSMGLLDYGGDDPYLDVLQYCEVRELIRASIIARSAPAPG